MGNESRQTGVQRQSHREVLEITHTVTERKNACNGLVSRLLTTEERLPARGDTTVETFKTATQKRKKKNEEETPEYPRTVRRVQKI